MLVHQVHNMLLCKTVVLGLCDVWPAGWLLNKMLTLTDQIPKDLLHKTITSLQLHDSCQEMFIHWLV